jgi:RNA polymerase sigma-70 factor, ECF subfamily
MSAGTRSANPGATELAGSLIMAAISKASGGPPRVGTGWPAEPQNWVEVLSVRGPERDQALRRLHDLLLRAARHQIHRLRRLHDSIGPERVDEIANEAADEALVVLLARLHTFEGRSRFTTWAYKFAILQVSTEVRRLTWRDREVPLDTGILDGRADRSPEQVAEASDLATATWSAIERVLTPHQRSVTIALLVDDVPIDVLAERLGTTRNALYKTLHVARGRLRAYLEDAGYLGGSQTEAGAP